MKIETASARAPSKPSIETITLEDPRPGEGLDRRPLTALCRTDIPASEGMRPAPMAVRFHSFAEIEAAIRDHRSGKTVNPLLKLS